MTLRTLITLISLMVISLRSALAGGSGLNVIVVVNQNSTNSVRLGNDYCQWRGVPPQNFLRITGWTGGSTNWSPGDFTNYLLNPLLGLVQSHGLTNQAQFVLLSMDIPYRVTDGYNADSTTAALFYGFKTNGTPVAGYGSCSLPDSSSNSYAYSEMAFPEAPPDTAVTNAFLAMMLTDTNFASAENTLLRAVAADSSFPTQMVYLAKTTDMARNVRYVEFDNAVFQNQVISNFSVARLDSNATSFTNLFGLQTGLGSYTLATNEFVPGGLGDTLTSYAGMLLENSGQTPALAFLRAGAAGSYGTVVEPCNYTQKFPDPIDYFYQTRGFSVAEAYYQSVLNPFQGIFVGEPLAAPFARRGSADWSSLTNGATLSGSVLLSLSFSAAATNLPIAKVDLFVDGTFFQTMTNLPPTTGNVISATLNGDTVNYTVPTNATLAVATAGLAAALNLQSNVTQVLAIPIGDRVELQSLSAAVPGSNVTVSVGANVGSASNLTSRATAARPAFLDTVATGYQLLTFLNAPQVGDWIQLTLIKTNGTIITLGVTNTTAGTTIGTLAQNLVNQINATPALQAADGVKAADFYDADPYEAAVQFYLYARTPGWPAAQILAMASTSTNLQATPAGTNPLQDNVYDLRPKNHLYLSSGADLLAVNLSLDTTQLPDGWHDLTAVAYEGTSVATQTAVTRTVKIQNTGLTATFAGLPSGTNAAFGQPLQFTVVANATNIARVELFSTGGSVGATTNQATAGFSVSTVYLGLGWHPFFALVTDQAGQRYQTQTLWYNVVPAITVNLAVSPPLLSWTTQPGWQYQVQLATNLIDGFTTVATLTATNSTTHWSISENGSAGYYRVKLGP